MRTSTRPVTGAANAPAAGQTVHDDTTREEC